MNNLFHFDRKTGVHVRPSDVEKESARDGGTEHALSRSFKENARGVSYHFESR